MQSGSPLNFSAKELRTRKKLYTFRKVAETINKNKRNSFVFYGSRDALSPNQYAIFREFRIKKDFINGVYIKLELIPANIFKSFRRFSQFEKRQTMLKGSTYQIKVTMPYSHDVSMSKFDSKTEAAFYKATFNVFEQFKLIRFSEKTHLDYIPSVFLSTTNDISTNVARFGAFVQKVKTIPTEDNSIPFSILQYNQKASFFIRRNIIFIQDKLISKTN